MCSLLYNSREKLKKNSSKIRKKKEFCARNRNEIKKEEKHTKTSNRRSLRQMKKQKKLRSSLRCAACGASESRGKDSKITGEWKNENFIYEIMNQLKKISIKTVKHDSSERPWPTDLSWFICVWMTFTDRVAFPVEVDLIGKVFPAIGAWLVGSVIGSSCSSR